MKIKNFFKKEPKTEVIDYTRYEHKWFSEYQKDVFLNYIEEKVLELAKNEGIPVFSVPFDEMNKNEKDENKKAVGLFIYYKNKQIRTEYETNIASRYNLPKTDLPREKVLPRIEISDQGDVYTILHELGHYFIYKRDQTQSEDGANMFFEEFFEEYLPPFFKWIYQIEIKIRTKKTYDYNPMDAYYYWLEYQEFKNNYDGK